MANNQKVLASIVLIAIFTFAGYLLISKKPNTEEVLVPADWKTYINEKYGFEFKYPAELNLYAEDDDVIIFVDPELEGTDAPLPRVEFGTNKDSAPLVEIGNKYYDYVYESLEVIESVVIDKQVIQKNPEIIKSTWSYKDHPKETYSKYLIVSHKNNGKVDYFDPNGFGGLELALSFKFKK